MIDQRVPAWVEALARQWAKAVRAKAAQDKAKVLAHQWAVAVEAKEAHEAQIQEGAALEAAKAAWWEAHEAEWVAVMDARDEAEAENHIDTHIVKMQDVRCSNCGEIIPERQILLGLQDAGVLIKDIDQMTFCCPSYSDEHGCQGNDESEIPYWYTQPGHK